MVNKKVYMEKQERLVRFAKALGHPATSLVGREGQQGDGAVLKTIISFDAVFGFTVTAMLGAKSTLQKHDLRIPNDGALCCMSDTALSTLVHPQLTAVEQPIGEMAKESCRLLMEHLADNNKETEGDALHGETVVREST